MKDSKNLEVKGYTRYISDYMISDYNVVFNDGIHRIVLTDDVKELHIQYKGKEYVLDLEKALKLLCKELENDE